LKIRNFTGAVAVAIFLALSLVKPSVAGVASWKIVLGVAGLILFVTAGMARS
jgi:hypothetical protein